MMERPCMRRFIQCNDDGEPLLHEEEIINLQMMGVELTFEKEIPPEIGTLYVTTRRVLWMSETLGYDFDVPYIMLHAITHDPESFPRPCLYCQFDEDDDGPSEVFLVPPKDDDLQTLFDAFSHAAMLNPDPNFEEDDDDQGLIYNVEEVELGAQQAAMLAHFESVFRAPGEVYNGVEGGAYDAPPDGDEMIDSTAMGQYDDADYTAHDGEEGGHQNEAEGDVEVDENEYEH